MSGASGKGGKAGRRVTSQKSAIGDIGDLTLNDFANCSLMCGKGRLKKGTNSVVREVKQLNENCDSSAWYEKLDDFNGDFEFVKRRAKGRSEGYVLKKTPRQQNDPISKHDHILSEHRIFKLKQQEGKEYPIDLWVLISEYIYPEDVGTFACVCKDANRVVCSVTFWYHLYRRFYKSVPNLPDCLEPENMFRKYGLRTNVIRALYHMYPPFIIRHQTVKEVSPQSLVKRQCIIMWHQKIKNEWMFYFKLKKTTIKLGRDTQPKLPDLIEMLDDITVNQEDSCKILQVTCHHFIALPIVLGLTLRDAVVTLSPGLCAYGLRLEFGSGLLCFPNTNSVVEFDSVVNIKILDWWHPLYPHANNLSMNLEEQRCLREDAS